MNRFYTHLRRRCILRIIPGVALAAFLLMGCGQVTHAGTAAQIATPAATHSPATGNDGAANGCPSKQIPIDGGAFHPAVTTTYTLDQGAAQPVTLTQGQGLEIDLSPAVQWSLTLTDPAHTLESVAPAGWYDASSNACVWRFTAIGAGAAHLAFRGPVLCRPNIHCTAVLDQATFDVTVR